MKKRLPHFITYTLITLISFSFVASVIYWAAVEYPDRSSKVFPDFKYHPLRIHYELKGIKVHPMVQFDEDAAVDLELWDVQWPIFWNEYFQYEEFLAYLIEGFTEIHGNVRVHVTLLHFQDYERAIKTALSQGDIPDVYIGPAFPELLTSSCVIPVDAFLTPENQALYDDRSLATLTSDKGLIGFPRTIGVYGWLADEKALKSAGLSPESILSQGWTWEDFLLFAETVKNKGLCPLAVDNFRGGARVLEQLVEQTGADPRAASEEGNVVALEFLSKLKEGAYFPNPPGQMYKKMVPGFWKGEIACIGPCGPGIIRHLLERSEHPQNQVSPAAVNREGNPNPCLLPVPSQSLESATVPLEITATVAMWSNGGLISRSQSGPDPETGASLSRARLAVELAQYLSWAGTSWVSQKLGVIPAYLPARDRWEILMLESAILGELERIVPSEIPLIDGPNEIDEAGRTFRASLLYSMKELLRRVKVKSDGNFSLSPEGLMREDAWRTAAEQVMPDFWEGRSDSHTLGTLIFQYTLSGSSGHSQVGSERPGEP